MAASLVMLKFSICFFPINAKTSFIPFIGNQEVSQLSQTSPAIAHPMISIALSL
jgi:hypothetical protein